jgi:hypothetical protein
LGTFLDQYGLGVGYFTIYFEENNEVVDLFDRRNTFNLTYFCRELDTTKNWNVYHIINQYKRN